jgi:hypothetical protein
MRSAACSASTGSVFVLGLLLALLPGSAGARHAPGVGTGMDPAGKSILAAESGEIFEVDRRSHPALVKGWDALLRSAWTDPRLAELPDLQGAQLLHADGEWALLWLEPRQAEALRSAGVRLNPPRPRPSETMRIGPVEEAMEPAALTVLQSLSAAVNIDQMMTHLNAIATTIQTRYYNTTGMQSATQYALDRFNQYGLNSAYFDNFTYNGRSVRNVVGVKTGSVYPNRIYMICGHLDSTSPQSSTLAPGAEDNGSGAVAVLEAARLMAPLTFESTIYFVCFTAEEQGLIGSEHLAAIADTENWDLRGVLVMDMVGYDTSGALDIWIEGFPSKPASVTLMNTLESVVNTYTDMGVYRYPSGGYGSDHVPFNSHGFPALLAIDYDWDSYSCYHKTCDTVANIVPVQFRRMAVSVLVTGAQLAVPTSGLGSVAGITDKTDSMDDSGVQIMVKSTAYAPATSGTGGAFTLADLLPGAYTLRANAGGYETVETAVTITAGQATAITIPLNPVAPSRISGVVSLQGGADPSGTRVFAENQTGYAQAGPSGTYLLEPVTPGPVVVSADHDGYMPATATVTAPSGVELTGVNFTLKPVWDFESANEGLVSSSGWEWGSDSVTGAHSGTKVWGTKLNTNYANCADYRLDLPPLDLRFYETARIHFWHWYKTESGYDGGNVQVSTDGGSTWAVVAPLGGYAGTLTGTCNPISGQQGYVGTKATWTEAIVDLGAYAGSSIRVRFRFGSDGGTVDRGWYIDDISLEGTLAPVGIVENPQASLPLLYGLTITPNPAPSSAGVRFSLGAPGATWVTVFDASGRKVRGLLESVSLPAGPQMLSWDGRDDADRSVPAGVYWVRVFANGRTSTRSVALLR